MNKVYFKVFLGFFTLILIGGSIFFWIRARRGGEQSEGGVFEEKETVLPSRPPLEESLPTEEVRVKPSPEVERQEFELSTSEEIGQFAADWELAKRRNQDGRLAETSLRIQINPDREVREAILVFNPVYLGEGWGEYEVYISREKQVKEKDEEHNFSSWWVGDEAELGKKIREEPFKCSGKGEVKVWEVTDFIKQGGGGVYFVAFLNKAKGGMAVEEVYLRVFYQK